jgi:pimeloyl-ACP methyl ester carboxylesterase
VRSLEGSNPSLSAKREPSVLLPPEASPSLVYGAGLEYRFAGNRIEGSNPSASAKSWSGWKRVMPYATNTKDQVRTWFEDSGGSGPPILVYPGFSDPLEYAKTSPLVQPLQNDYRLIFADHRGQGRSDKPHNVGSYALRTRVLDAVAVLDALEIERAHYIGFSWGARLGFAVGEYAPERLLSLVLSGNQPYEWPLDSPLYKDVSEAVAAGKERGIVAFVETWESLIGERFPEPSRGWMLENDALALDAELHSALIEGPISNDLTAWRVPCLIYAGAEDVMHEGAARAAAEIPGAVFLSLPGHTHFSADRVADEVIPAVLKLLRSATIRAR